MSGLLDREQDATAYIERTQLASRATAVAELGFAFSDESSGWDRIVDDLLRIRMFDDDWDGEGSAAPNVATVDSATSLAQHLRHRLAQPDRVNASVNGTVNFEWYRDDGFLEIEVSRPDQAEVRWIPKGASHIEVFRLEGD